MKTMKTIKITNQVYDEERALYNLKNAEVINCKFAGAKDGESALKECRNINVIDCSFSLRYPLWHAKNYSLVYSSIDELARASIWYSSKGYIENSKITGVKCLRECKDTIISNCEISSSEFGWECNGVNIYDSKINSIYFLFRTRNAAIDNLVLNGRYACQYTNNVLIENSILDTKDAFWHAKNITVENSAIHGKYIGWYSDNLTFINCKITGAQPFCYCKNIKLVNCEMEDTELGFEYSDNLDIDIKGHLDSIKNPRSGIIKADSIGETITEGNIIPCNAEIILRK